MIAISSMRPVEECADEIAFNQFDAFTSWLEVFEKIYFFNSPQPDMDDPKVEYIEASRFPTIRELAIEASQQEDWTALINADIQVHPKLSEAVKVAVRQGAVCAMTFRHEIPESGDLCRAQVVDNGLDLFLALPDIWARVAREIPAYYRIGHPVWDTWVLGFFMLHFGRQCADLTGSRVAFHPRHGERKQVYHIDYDKADPVLAAVRYPKLKIAV